MISEPSKNLELIGLDHYFNEITNLYNNKNLPNKILLSGKKGTGKSTLAHHIINYIFSKNEDNKYDKNKNIINKDNKSFKLIENKSHPNFYLIDLIPEKKIIEIAQIRKMISHTNKSSFNDKPRFILIDNIENLNINSTNALLKIIEEPNDNIFFILIHDSEKRILTTLKSRCLYFKIHLTFLETINITNTLIKNDLFKLINLELINYYNTPGDFIKLIVFSTKKNINLNEYNLINFLYFLIDNGYYKKDKYVKKLVINLIELYFLKKLKIEKNKKLILDFYYNFINKIYNTEIFNLDEESLFLEFKTKMLNG